MIQKDNKDEYKILYPNLEWLFGISLNVPDEICFTETKWNDLDIEEEVNITCRLSFGNWDEHKPVYRYMCEYEDGNCEIIYIPIKNVLEKLNLFHNLNNTSNKFRYRDDIDFVIECCISERLKLIN